MIAGGVVAYILLSSATALIECRRNLPFIPLLLLVCWYALRRRAASTVSEASGA